MSDPGTLYLWDDVYPVEPPKWRVIRHRRWYKRWRWQHDDTTMAAWFAECQKRGAKIVTYSDHGELFDRYLGRHSK